MRDINKKKIANHDIKIKAPIDKVNINVVFNDKLTSLISLFLLIVSPPLHKTLNIVPLQNNHNGRKLFKEHDNVKN